MSAVSQTNRLSSVNSAIHLILFASDRTTGALLHGAGLSRKFKTKHIKVADITAHDIQASYLAVLKSVSAKLQTMSTLIVPVGTIVSSEKMLMFKLKEDFAHSMGYKPAVSP